MDSGKKAADFIQNINNLPPAWVHQVLDRDDVENLVGEAKQEQLDSIPSARFKWVTVTFKRSCWSKSSGGYCKIIIRREFVGSRHFKAFVIRNKSLY